MCDGISIEEVRKICKPVDVQKRIEKKEEYSDIVRFNKIMSREQLDEIHKKVRDHVNYDYEDKDQKHLWSFYGRKDNDKWFCIEVGSSDDILEEICGITKLMFEESKKMNKKSALHGDIVIYKSLSYVDKICFKYRYINSLFDEFWWIEHDVESFQGGNKEYGKTNYAEVKCAVEDQALVWNPAPATTNGRNRKNREREILNKVFGIN